MINNYKKKYLKYKMKYLTFKNEQNILIGGQHIFDNGKIKYKIDKALHSFRWNLDMILIDCISRQVPGVLGNLDSLEESRVSSHDVFTRPEIFEYKKKKYRVPKVLLSGNHKKIEDWKTKKS